MPSTWRGRPVLVTGGTGFIGSWLVAALSELGAEVVGLVRDRVPLPWSPDGGGLDEITLVQGSLDDFAGVERVLGEYQIETIFHLAAQTIVGIALGSPLATFEANIRGTWNLLEAARAHQSHLRGIVVASSDKAYGDQGGQAYTEDMPLLGRSPYDVSKSCADLLAQSYHHTYGLPVVISRSGNVYGGGDRNYSRLVPGTIRALRRGEPPVIRGDGSSARDYLYVADAVRAYLCLGEAAGTPGVAGEAFNFAGGRVATVVEVVDLIARLMGCPDLPPRVLGGARNEIRSQRLDTTKGATVLGWRPDWRLEDGLRQTIDWYLAHPGGPPMLARAAPDAQLPGRTAV